jgi:Tfp pilus assembly protein PilF
MKFQGSAARAAALLVIVLLSGCVRRTVAGRQPVISPDDLLRSVFRRQTQGAFDPQTDDRRVQTLQARLRLDSRDAAARLELAQIYESYGLFDHAIEQYMEALKLVTSETGGPLIDRIVEGLGRSAQASRRVAEAVPVIAEVVKQRPSTAAWSWLGLLYDAVGDLEAGETAFREAIARGPRSEGLHNNLGYNLLRQNRIEPAEVEFHRALELNPKSPTVRNNLGSALARRGDLQRALEQFQFGADAATAHNNLAVVLLEAGQYESSREQLVKALTIRRYFAPALANFKLVQDRIRERAELQKQPPPAHAALRDGPEPKDPEE